VPSRARVFALGGGALGVGDEVAVDDVGQASFEAAQGFHRGLAGGELASVVGAALGVVAQLHDGGDVDDVVHPAVAGAGEAVADLFAEGRVQGCGAGPGGEPAMSPTSATIRAAPAGPTPWICIRLEPRSVTAVFSSALSFSASHRRRPGRPARRPRSDAGSSRQGRGA
jgi:hypothetical protein